MNWPSSSRLSFPYFLIPWYHGENMVSGLEHLHAGNSAQVLPLEIVLILSNGAQIIILGHQPKAVVRLKCYNYISK